MLPHKSAETAKSLVLKYVTRMVMWVACHPRRATLVYLAICPLPGAAMASAILVRTAAGVLIVHADQDRVVVARHVSISRATLTIVGSVEMYAEVHTPVMQVLVKRVGMAQLTEASSAIPMEM